MAPSFGIVSVKSSEPDQLGRMRQWVTLHTVGMPGSGGPHQRFDLADLEVLANEPGGTIPEAAMDHWPEAATRAFLPWALVHAAIPATAVASLHSDAVCTLGDAPGSRSLCGRLLGDDVSWIAGASPGPALARALASIGGSAVVVAHAGLMTWGETIDEALLRAAALEEAAASGLAMRHEEADVLDRRLDADTERALVGLRGQLSRHSPAVLHVDASLQAIAERPDATRVMTVAATLEVTAPWSTRLALLSSLPEGGDADTVLAPGIGQVSAGRDALDARKRGIVAAHVHRVAATLVDGFGGADDGTPTEPHVFPVDRRLGSRTDRPAAGRVYIVTGAASGIGRDVARHLARLGAQLGLADIATEGLELVADELDDQLGRPVTVAGDLTDESVVDRLVAATIERFGGVDGAVFNVGVALPGEIRGLSATDWRRSLDVNTTSHFLLAKRLLPALAAQGLGGSLVFIGSKNMFSPGAGFGAYSASKAALAQLARVVAIEAGPFGVRSNIVNPDNVFEGSALWSPELRAQRASVYGIKPEDLEAYYTQRNLMKVPITGMDVAKAVAFLLSDDAARTTACVLTVDGGVPGVFPR